MLFTLLAVQLIASRAGADLSFSWSAPATCPPVESLRARLTGLAGTAAATVTERPGGWTLEVRIDGKVRVLSTDTCEEAADAAVLIIRLGASRLAPATGPAPPPAELPAAVEAPLPAPPAWGLRGSLLAGVGIAWLPQPVLRLGGSVSVRRGPVALALDATSSPAVRFRGGPTPSATVTVQIPLDVQMGGCWLFQYRAVEVGPCLNVSAAWFKASGENVSNPQDTSIAAWAAGAGARAWLSLLPWLELHAAAGARFGSRPTVFFQSSPPVVVAGPLSVELSAGIGARL